MDPNAALAHAREATQTVLGAVYDAKANLNEFNYAITDLAETFDNLDEWLSKGGFLPSDWQRP
jgi:hypothetical protein